MGSVVGEEEEGVVSDPGTEILSESEEKMKVLHTVCTYKPLSGVQYADLLYVELQRAWYISSK